MGHLQHKNTLPMLEYTLNADGKFVLVRTNIGMLLLIEAMTLKAYRESLASLRQDCHIGPYITQMIEQSEERFNKCRNEWLVKKLTSYRHIKTNQCEKRINYSVVGLPPVIRFTIK